MRTQEINKAFESYSRRFKGPFPRDMIPNLGFNEATIINTDASTDPGQHWIALFKDKTGRVTYFDSFGLPPLHEDIIDWLCGNSNEWIYNNTTLQHIDSRKCGQYCILFLFAMFESIALQEFLSLFTNNTKVNELLMRIYEK